MPGYSFTKWRTQILHWDDAGKRLQIGRTIDGAIPWLVASFRRTDRTSSAGFLYPALTVEVAGKPNLILRRADGTRQLVAPE